MNKEQRTARLARFVTDQVKKRRLSLREFARRSDLSFGYLSHLMNDPRSIPKPATLRKIAMGLGVDDAILFDVAGMGYLVKDDPNTTAFIEKRSLNGHEYLVHDGQVLDKSSAIVIQRILDSLPNDANNK